MILDPMVVVECDYCGTIEHFDMTALSCRTFDMRDLDGQMARSGWVVDGEKTYCCKECAEQS